MENGFFCTLLSTILSTWFFWACAIVPLSSWDHSCWSHFNFGTSHPSSAQMFTEKATWCFLFMWAHILLDFGLDCGSHPHPPAPGLFKWQPMCNFECPTVQWLEIRLINEFTLKVDTELSTFVWSIVLQPLLEKWKIQLVCLRDCILGSGSTLASQRKGP